MGLFKRESAPEQCDCSSVTPEQLATAGSQTATGAAVKILGSGCQRCQQLEANTVAALAQLGRDQAVDHVTDFAQIAAFGVMTTPALVVDGEVVSYGKVLSTAEVVHLLQDGAE